MSDPPVIQVSNLKKTYRQGLFRRQSIDALNGVSLEVPGKAIYGLLGPNGAGKTTLIKILLGLVRKSGGDASVLQLPAGSLEARRQIGYLPENHRIPGHLTGKTALEYFGSLSGLSVAETSRRAPELLDQVGLTGREKERVTGYSKGMLQRLGLAQAMLHRPKLIVLDEPTDGVDPVGRSEIRQVLKTLSDLGTTIFLNSHLLQEIELVCESVAILTKGKVRRVGRVEELKASFKESPLVFRIACERTKAAGFFEGVNVTTVEDAAEGQICVNTLISSQQDVDRTVDRLRTGGISILSMTRRELTLEEAFLQIVQDEDS